MDHFKEQSEGDPEDSLANTPLQTADDNARTSRFVPLTCLIVTAVGGVSLLLSSTQSASRGATRSSKLEWQRRQQCISQAEIVAKLEGEHGSSDSVED
jgi:hypothetical protein